MILTKEKKKGSVLPIIFGSLSGLTILAGLIAISVIKSNSMTDDMADYTYQADEQIEEETVEEVAPTPEFENNIERLPEFGDYVAKIAVEDSMQFQNSIPAVTVLFSNSTGAEMAAIEKLLLSADLTDIYPTDKSFTKNYIGDKFWKFEDGNGYIGAICIKEGFCYLFYYGEEFEDEEEVIDDPFLNLGLEFSSYGTLQPKQNFFVGNALYNDLPMEEADKVLSALFTGEQYAESSQFYLARDAVYTYSTQLQNFDYTAYRVNKDLAGTFIEVYIYDDKFYNMVTEIDDYAEIVDREVLCKIREREEAEEVESGEDVTSIYDFRDGMIKEFVWDGEDRLLWDAVLKTSTKDANGDYMTGTLQQVMQYGLESMGLTSCEFIGETDYVNGYPVTDGPVFIVKVNTSDELDADYYISINEIIRSIIFYPPNVTPG